MSESEVPAFSAKPLPSNIDGPDGWHAVNLMRMLTNAIRVHLGFVGRKEPYLSLTAKGNARMLVGLTRKSMEDLMREPNPWKRPPGGILIFPEGSQERAATTSMSTSNGMTWRDRHDNINSAFRGREAMSLFQVHMVATVHRVMENLSTTSGHFTVDAFTLGKTVAIDNSLTILFGQRAKPSLYEGESFLSNMLTMAINVPPQEWLRTLTSKAMDGLPVWAKEPSRDDNVDLLLSSALSPLTALLPHRWPFPYYRISKALRALYAWAQKIAEDKRSNPDQSIASMMVNRLEADHSLPPIDRVVGDMIALYVTSRDGPASDIAWTLFLLAAFPQYQHRLREELMGMSSYDSPLLRAIINESRRLFPAAFVLNPRMCCESYEFEGIQIPRGAMAFGSILVRHRDPDVWSNAQMFDPDRWLKPGFKPNRYDYIPFGTGERSCVGDQVADNQTKTAVAELIRRYYVSLDPKAVYDYFANAILTQPRLTNQLHFTSTKHAPPPEVSVIKGNVHDLVKLPR